MKTFAAILVVLLHSAISFGQDKSAASPVISLNSGCGDPTTESQLYTYRFGKVTEVTDDNHLTVEITRSGLAWDSPEGDWKDSKKLTRPGPLTITLVGIDGSVNKQEINAFLRTNLIGKKVTITGNKRSKSSAFEALVEFKTAGELEEVNEYLLERGLAKFNNFTHAHIVPMTTACELKEAEKRARDAKLGMWSAR
jgi:hypothetical protein